jgi:hypothetical protein
MRAFTGDKVPDAAGDMFWQVWQTADELQACQSRPAMSRMVIEVGGAGD